jgi:ribonucleoside-triphosphate reductase
MTVELIKKRDGNVVKFKKSKIKNAIRKAVESVKLSNSEQISKEVLEEVLSYLNIFYNNNEDKTPTVEEVQDLVEKSLMQKGHTEVAKSYILYRNQHQTMRETQNAFEDAVNEIDNYLDESDWKTKENSNMDYSLQGMNNFIVDKVTSHYWLQKIYSDDISNAHAKGEIHIHDLGNLSVYCCGWDLKDILLEGFSGVSTKIESLPPKHFDVALMQLVNFFFTVQGESAGAQAVSSFDTYLAPFIAYDDLSYEEVKQSMQKFLFNINVPTRVGFQSPFTNITMDLEVPEHMLDEYVIVGGEYKDRQYKEFQEEMDMVNKAYAEVMIEGDKKGRVFSFPIPTYNITPDFDWDNPVLEPIWEMTAKYGISYFSNFVNSDMDPEDTRSMCCRLRLSNEELRKRGGGLFGANPLTGSIGVITLNLPRIGYKADTQEEYIEKIYRLMDIAKESLETKRKVLEKLTEQGLYPYSKFYLRDVKKRMGSYWANHFNTIGILGMNESLINFIGKDITTEEGIEFSQ